MKDKLKRSQSAPELGIFKAERRRQLNTEDLTRTLTAAPASSPENPSIMRQNAMTSSERGYFWLQVKLLKMGATNK